MPLLLRLHPQPVLRHPHPDQALQSRRQEAKRLLSGARADVFFEQLVLKGSLYVVLAVIGGAL